MSIIRFLKYYNKRNNLIKEKQKKKKDKTKNDKGFSWFFSTEPEIIFRLRVDEIDPAYIHHPLYSGISTIILDQEDIDYFYNKYVNSEKHQEEIDKLSKEEKIREFKKLQEENKQKELIKFKESLK